MNLKPLNTDAVMHAIERAEHYRLLNEPRVAESICQDILEVDAENQKALIILLLAITDQFSDSGGSTAKDALEIISRLADEHARNYHTGIIYERQAKSRIEQQLPDARYDAYDLMISAMEWFEKSQALESTDNKDAILRWNNCARTIKEYKLKARPDDDFQPYLE
ncbi:MAG: hypothetical protein QGI34_14235 [Candidatus Latescibacteria bacterium]|nr:hypothetical protein [Candidatus Latescibacterota bacterium]